MNSERYLERDQLLQQLGACEERVRQSERRMVVQCEQYESDAREWQRLQRHRIDLAEWLIDTAINAYGTLTNPLIDARLGGELFVPCSFTATANGRRFRFDLVSTEYEIHEVPGNG